MTGLPPCLTEDLSPSDRELIARLDLLEAEAQAWDALRSERARQRWLGDRRKLGDRLELFELVGGTQADSLTALVAKADYHLREERKKDFADRTFKHIWAGVELTLEQAIGTLQQVREIVPIVKIR